MQAKLEKDFFNSTYVPFNKYVNLAAFSNYFMKDDQHAETYLHYANDTFRHY